MTDSKPSPEAWLSAVPGASECLTVSLSCDLVVLAQADADGWHALWTSDASRIDSTASRPLSDVVREVRESRAPVCQPEWAGGGSLLAVPLLGLPDDPGVALILTWSNRRALVNQDVRFASHMAALLSEAGQGAWLRRKLFQPVEGDRAGKSRARDRAACLETLNFISDSAREGKLFNEIATETMHRLVAGLGLEFGALYFGMDGVWILVAHTGFDDAFPMAAGFLPASHHAWTALSEPACDFEVGEPLAGSFAAAGARSWAVLPMFEEDEVKGGMLLASRTPARFPPDLVDLFTRVSRQLQSSLLQARLARDLLEQAADLNAVLGSLSDAVIEVTADRCVMQANAAAEQLLGVAVGGHRADDWQSLVPLFDMHRDEQAGEAHPVAQTFLQATAQKATSWRLVRGDRTVYVSASAAPIMDESKSRVRAAVLVVRDVTEQRAGEQKLLAAEKQATLSGLAAGVAHEFKNYLAGLMGHASLALQARHNPEVVATAMQRILDIGERANQTALSLHSFAGDSRERPEVLELGYLLREVTCLFEQRALGQSVEVAVELEPDVCVNGVPSRLRQAVFNLLENALEAMPEGGRLEVRLSGDSELARIEIRDTGSGIPPEQLSRVFDPFFSTKGVWGGQAGAGTGLGLTTSANYVRAMKGEISLDSTPGQGTEVRLVLPRVHRSRPAVTERGLAKSAVLWTSEKAGEAILKALASEGWETAVVTDLRMLEAHLPAHRPTLAFLDATLPGKLNFIRAFDLIQSVARDCQIAVVTGTATDYQVAEYVGAAAFRLVAPVTADQLLPILASRSPRRLPA